MNASGDLQSSDHLYSIDAGEHRQRVLGGGVVITPVPAGHTILPSSLGRQQQAAEKDVMLILPVVGNQVQPPKLSQDVGPGKRGSRPRRMPLVTLRSNIERSRRAAADARDFKRGLGLQRWISTLLAQRQTFELNITVLSFILHALWKKPSHRYLVLRDAEYRKKVFNEFILDVMKAYQKSENIDENVPNNASDKDIRSQEKKSKRQAKMSEKRRAAVGGAPEPLPELPDLLTADPSDDEWRPPDNGTGGDTKATKKEKKTPTPGRRRGMALKLPDLLTANPSDDEWRPPGEGAGGDAKATKKLKKTSTPGRGRGRPRLERQEVKPKKPSWRVSAPIDTAAAAPLSGDLCSRLPNLIRTAARRPTRDLPCRQLAEKDEDDSAVPYSSFLFIRCIRCPEIVFTDYRAIREHWEARCHFLSCIMCDNIVSNSRLALAHLRLEHKDPVPDGWFRLVRCHQCNQSGFYSTEQVISHMAGHRAERSRNPTVFPTFLTCYKFIRCNQCGMKKVNHRKDLEDHYKRDPPPPCQHDPLRPPPIPCPVCGRMWAGAAALAAHMRHRQGHCKGGVTPGTVERAICPVCHRRLLPGESMSDHLMTHQAPGLRCVECSFVAASHEEMKAHWAFTWRCDCAACDTHVGRGSRLLQHVVEDHDGGKLLTETARARPIRYADDQGLCPICGKHQGKVKEHIVTAHTTRYCPCCDKVLATSTWRKHRRRQRNPEKLRCKICHKVLSSGYAMIGHMRRHTGERPFECELCLASFPQRGELNTHMKATHGILMQPPGSGDAAAGTTP